jgi:hypothetical protein
MARVYNGFLSYRLFAGEAAAGLRTGLAEAARRGSERLRLTSTNDRRDGEYRRGRLSVPAHLPGSLFDARYHGLAAHAAALDAAVCRRQHLRQLPREAPCSD